MIVIDAYMRLGAHLFEALGRDVAVVGVAKNEFHGGAAERVVRGTSKKTLFVTAIGVALPDAAAHVRAMHGAHRIPTLRARADRLARG